MADKSISIWKFRLVTTGEQTVTIPDGAEILSVQMKNDIICFWAKVDPNAKKHQARFRLYGTGQPLPDIEQIFIGTVMTEGGRHVVHVFYEPYKRMI